MKKGNKKSNKIQVIVVLVIAILVLVGVSYAALNFDVLFGGTEEHSLNTCKLSLNVKDDNPLTLIEAKPITANDAKSYTPYTFTITNNSDCDKAYYRVSLIDVCTSCSQTDGVCTVNGQALNCTASYKINSSKIRYELVNKTTGNIYTNLNPESNWLGLENTSLNKDESVTYELRLWIDENATNSDLYVYENGKPKTNSDGSIVTKNAGYKLNIESQNNAFSS